MEITRQDVQELVELIPGDMAIYQVCKGLKGLYCSPSLPGFSGLTAREYQRLIADDASRIIIEGDRTYVAAALKQCLLQPQEVESLYRIYHKERGFVWIHAKARNIGALEGYPVILVLFLNVSFEITAHERLLDRSDRIIFVCDRYSRELLYANAQAEQFRKGPSYRCGGATCHAYLRGRQEPCQDCRIRAGSSGRRCIQESLIEEKGRYFKVTGEYITWCGREAYAGYWQDITEQRARELAIARQEAELTRTMMHIPLGIFVLRRIRGHLSLVTANPFARYLSDLEGLDQSWRGWFYSLCRDDRHDVLQQLETLFTTGRSTCLYRLWHRERNRYVWIQAEGQAVFESDISALAYIACTDVTTQKETQQELADNETRYRLAVSGAQMIVWECDLVGQRITVPAYVSERYHVGPVIEPVPSALLGLLEKGEEARFLTFFKAMQSRCSPESGEFWFRPTPDRPACCIRFIYTVRCDSRGQPVTAYGIGQDITAQRWEERSYKQFIHNLFVHDVNSVGSIHLNLTKNTCITDEASNLFYREYEDDRTVEGFFDRAQRSLVTEEECKAFQEIFNLPGLLQAFAQGTTGRSGCFQWRMDTGDIRWIRTSINMAQNPLTGDIEAVALAVDIHDTEQIERIIQRLSRENYEFLGLVNLERAVITLRHVKEGSLLEEFYPCREYSRFVSFLAQYLVPEGKIRFLRALELPRMQERLRTDDKYAVSCDFIGPDGNRRRKRFSYSYMDESRQDILILGTDVTAEYQQGQQRIGRIQDALLSARRASQAKSRFLSTMSHDMRTPLQGILGFTRLAIEAETGQEKKAYLEKIRTSGRFLQEIINDTLDMSRIESGHILLRPEVILNRQLITTVVTAVQAAAEARQVRFIVDTSRSFPVYISIDSINAKKILLNLLSNAVKFTPPGGTVTFIIEHLEEPVQGWNWRFIVRDTGIGISPEFLPHIFEPFEQEHHSGKNSLGGTGLGLSIVKQLVERMGGVIEVDSELGKGTTFTMYMKLEVMPPPPAVKMQETELSLLEGKRVLLCEDHPLNRELACLLLEEKGMTAFCAENGQAGVEKFSTAPEGYFAAILMDIRMPVMDGFQAVRSIRSLPRKDARVVPVIAMTADAFDEKISTSRADGFTAYLTKPVEPDLLYRTLAKEIFKAAWEEVKRDEGNR